MNNKLIAASIVTVACLGFGAYIYFNIITSKTWLRTSALLDKTVNVETSYNIATKGWNARGYEVPMQSKGMEDKVCLVVFGTDISGVGVGCTARK